MRAAKVHHRLYDALLEAVSTFLGYPPLIDRFVTRRLENRRTSCWPSSLSTLSGSVEIRSLG